MCVSLHAHPGDADQGKCRNPGGGAEKGGDATGRSCLAEPFAQVTRTWELLLLWVPCVQVYEGLNTIGRVPYRINQRVHDVVLKAWEAGGGIGDLPVRVNLPEPAPLMDDAFYPSPEAKAAAIRCERLLCDSFPRCLSPTCVPSLCPPSSSRIRGLSQTPSPRMWSHTHYSSTQCLLDRLSLVLLQLDVIKHRHSDRLGHVLLDASSPLCTAARSCTL